MHSVMRFPAALALLACCAFSQTAPEPVKPDLAPPIAADESFFPHFQITPLPDGKKVVLSLDSGDRKLDLIVEPVPPKDSGETVQWVLYANGGGALYTKKTITLPGPDGGGTPVEGIIVSRLSAAVKAGIVPPPPAPPTAPRPVHLSTSQFTTLPHKDPNFRMPVRFDRAGPGLGRYRIWLLWDGQKEIQVEALDTNFKNTILTLPGFGNHIKYLSNVYTEGSPAPRFFYIKRNSDDSMTVYGDDNIDKLKAIEKKGK